MNQIAKMTLPWCLALSLALACRAFSPQRGISDIPVSTAIQTDQAAIESPLPASPTVSTGGAPNGSILPVPTTATNSNTAIPNLTPTEKGKPTAATYAIILVAVDDALNVRSQPGPQGEIIGQIPPDGTGISLTGVDRMVGDQRWVEISLPDGGTGWANAQFLTEYRSSVEFCADPRIPVLIENLKSTLDHRDEDQLATLVSPIHGLNLNYFRTGNRVHFSPQEVAGLFDSQMPINWGTQPASGMDVSGTFRDEVLPKLDEVMDSAYKTGCNDPALGPNSYIFQWPTDYKNINFISLTKPGSPGVELDWRTWLVGVDYVDGKPYIFALMQLFWEP